MNISKLSTPNPAPAYRYCIGATFTAEPLKPVFSFWGRRLLQDFDIRFAPYNQVEQTLLDANGEFAANTTGVNIVAIRLEDLGGLDLSRIGSNTLHLVDVIRSAQPSMSAPLILCVCPPSRAFSADSTRTRVANSIAEDLRRETAILPGIHFVHFQEIDELYPVEEYEASGGGELGHVPYTEMYYAALGTALVRRAQAIARRPHKVIALDCDNTLWSGICGEDGPTGIALDGPHRDLQQFMLEQRAAGVLLTMCSKNNERDVIETFERNPDMPLQPRHFAAWRINWESKADNLAALAKELDLGLDTFIFVDDNPKECAEVESSAPEVLSVPLPAAVAGTRHFLQQVWAFDHGAVTDEDRKRGDYYAQNRKFDAEIRRATNTAEFLAGLNIQVRIAPLTAEQVPRAAQLTQRANQFNFTTIRRTEGDIQRLLDAGTHECLTVAVSDRFGEYGLVGVIFLERRSGELTIDTLLLSCRVLGRGVEHRLMAFLAESAEAVVARLEPTARNTPARQFLDSIGAGWKSESNGVLTYRFSSADLRALEWKPASTTAPPVRAGETEVAAAIQEAPDYVRFASALATPAQILAEMRRENRGEMVAPAANPPSTDTERKLAEIWADLLQAASISTSDNFFDLGGHSLLAVLLLVRIQETFGVDLSIDDVYSGALTLAELAQRIDALQLGGIDSAEYAELLREIEALSDEEARRMLAETEPESGCGYS